MATWVDRVNFRASLLVDQIVSAHRAADLFGTEIGDGMADLYRQRLSNLYLDEMPLAQMLDGSDLVLHAEGPEATGGMPSIHAVNWLISNAERQIRALARALFALDEASASRIANGIDLRLSGFAPGSIYAGVRLEPMEGNLLEGSGESPIYQEVRAAIRAMPSIPTFVDDESLNDAIFEAMPDPAKRDAGLSAALHLSPTGRIGIHTLELSVPGGIPAKLSQRERVVLRDALRHPKLSNRQDGSFVGEIREIDLDKTRFHLRNIPGMGAIRCVLPTVTADTAKRLLGTKVRVSGEYETDKQGMPRLMLVSSIEPMQNAVQEILSYE